MNLQEILGLQAGGPGSGRHPEADKFEKGKVIGRGSHTHTSYTAPSGHTVQVHEEKSFHNDREPSVRVGQSEKDSYESKNVFTGPKNEAQKVLSDKFGIDYKGRKGK